MVIGWLLGVAMSVVGVVLDLFDFLPAFTLPASLDLTVAIPFVGSGTMLSFNQWFIASILVCCALVVGKVLQWLYAMVPFKAT